MEKKDLKQQSRPREEGPAQMTDSAFRIAPDGLKTSPKSAFVKVLIIEDNPGDARLMGEMLAEVKGTEFDLEWLDRLSTGLERLAGGGIDVALLDLSLPDSQGLDTFVKAHEQAPGVPIIVLTGLDDEELAVKAVRQGAQDYLVKGQVDNNLLVRAVRYAIERKRTEQERLEREKLQGILEIAGAVCHELNQPLQAIFGYYDLLMMDMSKDNPLCGDIKEIKVQVDRMAGITKKLMRITRYETRDYIEGRKIVDIDKASGIVK